MDITVTRQWRDKDYFQRKELPAYSFAAPPAPSVPASNHNSLLTIQGGSSTERYHLDLVTYNKVTNIDTLYAAIGGSTLQDFNVKDLYVQGTINSYSSDEINVGDSWFNLGVADAIGQDGGLRIFGTTGTVELSRFWYDTSEDYWIAGSDGNSAQWKLGYDHSLLVTGQVHGMWTKTGSVLSYSAGDVDITTLKTNTISKLANGSSIEINAGHDAATGLRAYYNIEVYNTISFTDVNWNVQGSIGTTASNVLTYTATSGHFFDSTLVSVNTFSSGFAGAGWQLENVGSVASLTVDNLVVRREMQVYSLNVEKIRSGNGSYWFSDGVKVINVLTGGTEYKLYIDPDAGNIAQPFVVGDIVRCQNWTGSGTKYYEGIVSFVDGAGEWFQITIATLIGGGVPTAGDEIVRVGSTTLSRSGAVYITSNDTDSPYIDVVYGKTTIGGAFTTKVRLGRLDGITDTTAGLDGTQTNYFGLYSGNVHLTGHIHANTAWIGGWTTDANSITNSTSSGVINLYSSIATGGAPSILISNTTNKIRASMGRGYWNNAWQDEIGFALTADYTTGDPYFQMTKNTSTNVLTAKIANWNFDSTKLYNDKLELNSNGTITFTDFGGSVPTIEFGSSLTISGLNSPAALIQSNNGLEISETSTNTMQIQGNGIVRVRTLTAGSDLILSSLGHIDITVPSGNTYNLLINNLLLHANPEEPTTTQYAVYKMAEFDDTGTATGRYLLYIKS